jgi:hypothetical protein
MVSTTRLDPLSVEAGQRSGDAWQPWTLSGLAPDPVDEWARLREFMLLGEDDLAAMQESVEPLLQQAHALVVASYDHLMQDQGAAAVLGWEDGADEAHLAERRRFFTIWIARLLGLDMSSELADYLFRAGRYHAGHGPRHIHVPELYVTGAISLIHAAFARILHDAMPGNPAAPLALAGWHKLLSMHLHLMQLGYRAARAVDEGDFAVRVALFGLVRQAAGVPSLDVRVTAGARVETVLRKFFDYYPRLRGLVFRTRWDDEEAAGDDSGWLALEKTYIVRTSPAWRVLHNGRNLCHVGGPVGAAAPGDVIALYSPGR